MSVDKMPVDKMSVNKFYECKWLLYSTECCNSYASTAGYSKTHSGFIVNKLMHTLIELRNLWLNLSGNIVIFRMREKKQNL